MSNRVLRFINNTSHDEPLDTNQKGDILRTGDDEYSVRIDKSYHVLTDNVKTIETDEYLKSEKTDNTVDLSIDEQQFIQLIKDNCCSSTYQKQVITDSINAKFITDGNVFMYQQYFSKEQVDDIGSSSTPFNIELNEINNVRDIHENGQSTHTSTVTISGSDITHTLPFSIELVNDGLRLTLPNFIFARLNLEDDEFLVIDYTGILDFVSNDDDDKPIV